MGVCSTCSMGAEQNIRPPEKKIPGNEVRHIANMALFTGFYKCKYFRNGVYQPNSKLGLPQHDSLLRLERQITGTIYKSK